MKKNRVVCISVLLAGVTACGARVYSQENAETAAPHKIVRFADLKWAPIIKGCELAPVSGDANIVLVREAAARIAGCMALGLNG